MVGSVSPERKRDLEALLPKASYRITRDEEESVTTITTTKSWQQPETWFTDADKVHFIPCDLGVPQCLHAIDATRFQE